MARCYFIRHKGLCRGDEVKNPEVRSSSKLSSGPYTREAEGGFTTEEGSVIPDAHTVLLALKMEKGPQAKGNKKRSIRSCKRQGHRFFPEPAQGGQPCCQPDFSPMKATSDVGPPEL